MKAEDMVLVSVDDHVIEPAHLFNGRLPASTPTPHPGSSLAPTEPWPGGTRGSRSRTPL